jgi:hypothetical protein
MALFACRDADLEKSNTPEFGPLFSPYYAAGKLHSVSLLNSFLCRVRNLIRYTRCQFFVLFVICMVVTCQSFSNAFLKFIVMTEIL